ncbi:hypothetical protein F5984_03585 [Rudanella paleaurantiibacter]|uniref:Uncharacterized protein n=1 Tax=Rudanella paleaurantiibacter TaxID=2614655 RepID=A0A7J5U5S1_9BACT|nr:MULTISPECIES: hypothetical protein [Rudanella]KAB7733033.1 hypothetical protein F5984_03585 [Rudanella paleaurantiibacter]
MKLTNGYSGLVLEVTLGPKIGYGYVRLTQIDSQFGFYTSILDCRRGEPIKRFDFEEFVKLDDLVAPFLTVGRPPRKGKFKWRPLGYLPMEGKDYVIQDFKGGYPGNQAPELTKWSVVRGTAASEVVRDDAGEVMMFSYEQVKHLGYYGHMSLSEATSRIILEWMKILKMDYIGYEDEEFPKDLLAKQKIQVSVSIPYSEVPKEIRGKVII